jgi:hypothetical protein
MVVKNNQPTLRRACAEATALSRPDAPGTPTNRDFDAALTVPWASTRP